jgi:flagellar biosynthetic protein FlhB
VADQGDKHSKTEKPTPKHKKEARRKGQVAKSPELVGWITLIAGSMVLPLYFHSAEDRILSLTTAVIGVAGDPTEPGALAVLGTGLSDMMIIVLPILVMMMVIGVAANVAQVGFKIGGGAASPKLTNLSPMKGVKRLFSPRGLWALGKEILKLSVIGVLGYNAFSTLWHAMAGAQPADITPMVEFTGASLLHLVRIVAFVGLGLGLLDYAYQRHTHNKQMKMTKDEVKRENKDHQGNPLFKSEQKRRAMRLSRLRMLTAIAQADLVITNPTHVAVAIRYDKRRSAAPQVVATGADELAATIRAVATRNHVPIVEDPPLARAVYAACEIGDQIPKDLYMAVARLLAFVYALSPQLKEVRPVHRRPVSAMFA